MKRFAILSLGVLIAISLCIVYGRQEKKLIAEINQLSSQNERSNEYLRIFSQQYKRTSEPKIGFTVDAVREREIRSYKWRYTLSSKEIIPRVCIYGDGLIGVSKQGAMLTQGNLAHKEGDCPALVRDFQGTYAVEIDSLNRNATFDFKIEE